MSHSASQYLNEQLQLAIGCFALHTINSTTTPVCLIYIQAFAVMPELDRPRSTRLLYMYLLSRLLRSLLTLACKDKSPGSEQAHNLLCVKDAAEGSTCYFNARDSIVSF